MPSVLQPYLVLLPRALFLSCLAVLSGCREYGTTLDSDGNPRRYYQSGEQTCLDGGKCWNVHVEPAGILLFDHQEWLLTCADDFTRIWDDSSEIYALIDGCPKFDRGGYFETQAGARVDVDSLEYNDPEPPRP